MLTLYLDFQRFPVRIAVNSTSQVTLVYPPKGCFGNLTFSWASSPMYVVLSKHNYALSIKAIQVVWVWNFFL